MFYRRSSTTAEKKDRSKGVVRRAVTSPEHNQAVHRQVLFHVLYFVKHGEGEGDDADSEQKEVGVVPLPLLIVYYIKENKQRQNEKSE